MSIPLMIHIMSSHLHVYKCLVLDFLKLDHETELTFKDNYKYKMKYKMLMEHSIILQYETVPMDNWCMVFQRKTMPSSSTV
jgi:hypothetical protein